LLLFGDPEQVTQRIRELEAAGMNHLMLLADFGALEADQVRASLERFAHEVMPHFANRERVVAS
jgi:alkanesulfonate monooxygenase SsuD/methylene tetrahydromethanopterin reductase-like flavin-dependent oxidoreductase (luciferase family)